MWTPSFVSIAMYPFLMVLGDQISQHIEAVMEEYRIVVRFKYCSMVFNFFSDAQNVVTVQFF